MIAETLAKAIADARDLLYEALAAAQRGDFAAVAEALERAGDGLGELADSIRAEAA